jgi:hypothetical protein
MTHLRHEKGLWSLDSAQQLLGKLAIDLGRMKAQPYDPFPAFDFFVTAYHMCDWLEPANAKARGALKVDPLVRIAGHLATRAKHFRSDAQGWVQLASMEDRGVGPFTRTPMGIPTPLRVILHKPYSSMFAQGDVTAIAVARRLLDWWTIRINTGG